MPANDHLVTAKGMTTVHCQVSDLGSPVRGGRRRTPVRAKDLTASSAEVRPGLRGSGRSNSRTACVRSRSPRSSAGHMSVQVPTMQPPPGRWSAAEVQMERAHQVV